MLVQQALSHVQDVCLDTGIGTSASAPVKYWTAFTITVSCYRLVG